MKSTKHTHLQQTLQRSSLNVSAVMNGLQFGRLLFSFKRLQIDSYTVKNVITNVTILIASLM